MQLVLIIGLFAIIAIGYIVSLFALSKTAVRKLWMTFMLAIFAVAIATVLIIHFNTDLLGTFKDMTELYFAYFVIILLLAISLINIWIYKGAIWKVLRGKPLDKDLK